MVEAMKGEIAREFGLQVPPDGYWGHYNSKDLGKIGSQLKKRLPVLLEWKKHQRVRQGVKQDEGTPASPSS
jgi:hypothetical protein